MTDERVGPVCGVRYYPPWSAQGIRSVRCTKPARWTVVDPPTWSAREVCGVHAGVARRYGLTVLAIIEEES